MNRLYLAVLYALAEMQHGRRIARMLVPTYTPHGIRLTLQART